MILSVVLKTIKAFPNGSTLEELYVLMDCSFDDIKKKSLQIELGDLINSKEVYKGRDGKWRPLINISKIPTDNEASVDVEGKLPLSAENVRLTAVHANFESSDKEVEDNLDDTNSKPPDPNALLRYWRSALRADPRGAITQVGDRHGESWHLITGIGPVAPETSNCQNISIDLEKIQPKFRQALMRREANENTFAIGWPIAVGRKKGVPSIWPVGLLNAEWRKTDTHLEITIENNDIGVASYKKKKESSNATIVFSNSIIENNKKNFLSQNKSDIIR